MPLLSRLKSEEDQLKKKLTQPQRIRSLVVVPTKELVDQVCETSKEYTKPLKLSCSGLGVLRFKLEKALLQEKGTDLAVATLDRL